MLLSGPAGYPYYEWNTGSISEDITVFESGTFVLSIIDWIGCTSSSNSIQVVVDPLPIAAFSPNLSVFEIEFVISLNLQQITNGILAMELQALILNQPTHIPLKGCRTCI